MGEINNTPCIGCDNIQAQNFPTGLNWSEKRFELDTESQWWDGQKRLGVVEIRFCPVCGKDLSVFIERLLHQIVAHS